MRKNISIPQAAKRLQIKYPFGVVPSWKREVDCILFPVAVPGKKKITGIRVRMTAEIHQPLDLYSNPAVTFGALSFREQNIPQSNKIDAVENKRITIPARIKNIAA